MKISWSRLVFGLILVFGGIGLTILGFFTSLLSFIYSLPLIALGVWMLLNDKEDVIEERLDKGKSLNKPKNRK